MNSFVLHLILILVLGSLHMFVNKRDFVLLSAAASISVSTASKATILSSTLPHPSHHHATSARVRANPNTASSKAKMTLTSTLMRSGEASLITGARQNHSLQTTTKLSQKFNSSDRLHHDKSIYHGSLNADDNKTMSDMTSSTAAPKEKSQNLSVPLARRHQLLPTLSLNNSDHEKTIVQQPNNSARQQQIHKTPRMIHRLVAGHIQNTEERSTFQMSSITRNTSVSNVLTLTPSPLYFRRHQPSCNISSQLNNSKKFLKYLPLTTIAPLLSKLQSKEEKNPHDDDEALLDEEDFDNWDNGILRLSAGSGKESTSKFAKQKDESRKTLADQVRDGKYGLIENELFGFNQNRPGILSYLPNKEVPADNENNYGGLNEEDIWLAEDHLLVIKGGSLNIGDETTKQWPPIDDYDAPKRPIKIPHEPAVPPPFPVQIDENKPIQFIGNNKFTAVYPVANESIPVYSTITNANNTPSDSNSEQKKDIPARSGSSQNSAEGDPTYVYPAPYHPWLQHNHTFVNRFLKNTKPISFSGLGAFPFVRNGSFEYSNVSDYFDEDDISLYYPPAYSFVYKNNYTNPVPPGPLVPGIVLPPPPNQFSLLEKPDIISSTTLSPTRYGAQSPSSSTPPMTATTFATTGKLFKHNTKVSENTKKINLTAPTVATSLLRSEPIPDLPPNSHPLLTSEHVEPVPVPVEVPIPIYPSNKYLKSRPNIVSFFPATSEPTLDILSKANPIYYEYFEAKPQMATLNVIEDFLAGTEKPPSSAKPVKLYVINKRPLPSQGYHQDPAASHRKLPEENIVFITPKPEIRNNARLQMPGLKSRPLESFEEEVNAIHDTLRYYQNQKFRDSNMPRTRKKKPTYEYNIGVAKVLQPLQLDIRTGNFRPPAGYDDQPFKPMVTYSPPVGDKNAFRASAFDKVDGSQRKEPEQQPQPKYQSTTTLIPVKSEPDYHHTNGRPKNLHLGSNFYPQPLITTFPSKSQQKFQKIYQTTSSTAATTLSSWEGLGKNKYVSHLQDQPHQSARLQTVPELVRTNNQGIGSYYYAPPHHQPGRQNNRFFEAPFENSIRKIINYRPQHNLRHYKEPIWSLENDTYVNFAANRPPLNPEAEIINSNGSPAPSHQLKYYAPLERMPSVSAPNHQPIPQHRDILVNYRQPLPPINLNSEFISNPQLLRYQMDQFYRPFVHRSFTSQLLPLAQQRSMQLSHRNEPTSTTYFNTPKYHPVTNGNTRSSNANANPKANDSANGNFRV